MANPKGLALSYRHLHQNLDAAFKRSQDGLRACKATLLFLQQSAALEETFGNSMVKVRAHEVTMAARGVSGLLMLRLMPLFRWEKGSPAYMSRTARH